MFSVFISFCHIYLQTAFMQQKIQFAHSNYVQTLNWQKKREKNYLKGKEKYKILSSFYIGNSLIVRERKREK